MSPRRLAARLQEREKELFITKAALRVKDSHDHFDCAVEMAKLRLKLTALKAENETLKDQLK